MKVKMNVSLEGASVSYQAGHEYDVDDAFGKALVGDGRAVKVEPEKRRAGGKERQSKKPAGDVETR